MANIREEDFPLTCDIQLVDGKVNEIHGTYYNSIILSIPSYHMHKSKDILNNILK